MRRFIGILFLAFFQNLTAQSSSYPDKHIILRRTFERGNKIKYTGFPKEYSVTLTIIDNKKFSLVLQDLTTLTKSYSYGILKSNKDTLILLPNSAKSASKRYKEFFLFIHMQPIYLLQNKDSLQILDDNPFKGKAERNN